MANPNQKRLKALRVRRATSPVLKAALTTVGLAGAVGTIVVAPNATAAYARLLEKVDSKINQSRKSTLSQRMRKRDYFDIEDIGDGRYAIRLTDFGREVAADVLFEDYSLPTKQKWDGRWHIVMFDIEEKHKQLRNVLAARVQRLGMQPLQNSVYVYPYDVSEFCDKLRAAYPYAMQYVISAEASRIDGDDQLIELFHKKAVL